MSQVAIRYEDHRGLIHTQALVGLRWAAKAGVNMSYDDMYQEASEAFVYAANGFDESKDFKFSAYYTMAAFSCFRKAIGIMSGVKHLNVTQREEIAARRLENQQLQAAGKPQLYDCNFGIRSVSFADIAGGGDDEWSEPFESTIASEDKTPEQIVTERESFIHHAAKLSPMAQQVLVWLRDPPAEMRQELNAQLAHIDAFGPQPNMKVDTVSGESIKDVMNFLKLMTGMSRNEVAAVKTELSKFIDELEKGDE